MDVKVAKGDIASYKCDALVVGIYEDGTTAEFDAVNKALDNGLKKLMKKEGFKGEFKTYKIVRTAGMIGAYKVFLFGLGKKKEFDIEKLRRATSVSAKKTRCDENKNVATTLHLANVSGKNDKDKTTAAVEGLLLGMYRYDKHKTVDKDKVKNLKSVVLINGDSAGLKVGKIIAEATNYTRDLVNAGASEVTPTYLANECKKLGKKYPKLKVTVMNEGEMKKKGLNCILGVTAGTDQPAKFIIMEKKGPGKKLAIVGKGITFDSGGISIKPAAYMYDMKLDMAGAAAVIGTMKAVMALGTNANIIAAIPTCENMTGGSAQKPGDILTAYNGKTIEMLHSDAEGRLILADALSYVCKHYKPDAIIDLATLTGSIMVALGYQAAGLFGNDDKLIEKIKSAADETYDRVWEMPIYEEFREWVKAHNADVRNISKAPKGSEAGACTSAAFLENFVDGNWAHIDIAGTAFFAEDTDYLCKEGTGFGVRLLVNLIANWK